MNAEPRNTSMFEFPFTSHDVAPVHIALHNRAPKLHFTEFHSAARSNGNKGRMSHGQTWSMT